jgi:hypothetical protein
MWALTVLAVALTLVLASLNESSSSFRNAAVISLLILAFSTVGALVASRRPENPIGWLFCSGTFVWILGELALEYAVYAPIVDPGALPAGAWAVWFGVWARGVGWFLIVVFFSCCSLRGDCPPGAGVRFCGELWVTLRSSNSCSGCLRNRSTSGCCLSATR